MSILSRCVHTISILKTEMITVGVKITEDRFRTEKSLPSLLHKQEQISLVYLSLLTAGVIFNWGHIFVPLQLFSYT